MEGKKSLHIKLSTLLLILVLIVIIAVAYYIYTQNVNSNKEIVGSQSNSVLNNTENNSNTNNVSHVIVEVKNTSADELAYKMKIITDEKQIKSLIDIIDSAKEYKTTNFISDFGDIPPTVEVYLTNGEKYTIFAGDNIDDNGNTVNLITKWYKEDGSDKTLFEVDTKLAEYIENLYRTAKDSSFTSEKEIYKRVSIEYINGSELEHYNENFIVVENDTMYFSNNLSNKILEGTYKVNSNNIIEYNPLEESQNSALYRDVTLKIENINGIKNIVVDNSPKAMIYYQKVD